jgi:nitrogen PTS system EIIA component
MSLLSKLLLPCNVQLHVEARDKRDALQRAAEIFSSNQAISAEKIFDCLVAREDLGSTGLGKAVAIPHGRLRGLKKAAAALIRLEHPIPFDAPDGEPVRLMVVLLVPEVATHQHLQILSELAQMLSDTSLREWMLTEAEPAMLLDKLAAWEPIRPAA